MGLKTDDASVLAEKVRDMASNLEGAVEDAGDEGTEDLEREVQAQIYLNDLRVHGTLLASIDSRPESVVQATNINDYDLAWKVYSDAPYAGYVEYGTGFYNTQANPARSFKAPDPKPPYGPIFQWVLRKGFTGTDIDPLALDVRDRTDEDGNVVRRSSNFLRVQETLALAIREKIGKYGNRPHPFMRPAYREQKDDIVDGVSDAVGDTVSWR